MVLSPTPGDDSMWCSCQFCEETVSRDFCKRGSQFCTFAICKGEKESEDNNDRAKNAKTVEEG